MIDLTDTKTHRVFLVEAKGDTLIVTPTGEAFEFGHTKVIGELNTILDLVDEDVPQNLVIDLGRERYFGSVIIGAINSMVNKVLDLGGRAATCNASTEMERVITIMNLSDRWPNFPNRKKALKAVQSP
jgi:anti-anti-sigma regulatory factor